MARFTAGDRSWIEVWSEGAEVHIHWQHADDPDEHAITYRLPDEQAAQDLVLVFAVNLPIDYR